MSRQQYLEFNHLADLFGVNATDCLITFNSTNSAGGDERAGRRIDSADFAYQQIVSNNITVAALTLWIWEWLVALPAELYLYRTRKWHSPQALLLFMVRYGTLPTVILSAYLTFHNFEKGQECPQHTQLTIAVVQLIVSMTFGWRAIAIWRKDRRIVALVAFIVIAQFATSMTLLWFSDTVRLSNSTCMAVPSATGFNSFPWFYLTAMIVDGLLMLISTLKLWQFAEWDSPAAIRRRETSSHGVRSGTSSNGTHSANSTFNNTRSRPELSPNRSRTRSRTPSLSVANNVSTFRLKCLSLTPLLRNLLRNGLFYFLGAAAFNIVNLSLELSKNLHAKAVLQLYAPLMSVLASRVILLEVKALYGSRNGGSGSRERNLVEQVIKANQGKESWEGDDQQQINGNPSGNENQHREKEMEVGLNEKESSESPLTSNSNQQSHSSSSSNSDPDLDPSTSNLHRIIQIPSATSQVETLQSTSILPTPPKGLESRRPSAISFESPSNLRTNSRALLDRPNSNQSSSTPLLPQVVVEPEERSREEGDSSTNEESREDVRFKNPFNPLTILKKSSAPKDTSHPHFNSPSLHVPDLSTVPSGEESTGIEETIKSRKGSKSSSSSHTNHRHHHPHSRKSSVASTRSFDPSQMSDANRALALRMAGLDTNPKIEVSPNPIRISDDSLED